MKLAILTAISGLNNKLVEPKRVFKNADYFAFVDVIKDNSIWHQKKISDFTLDKKYRGRRNAKIYKILPHLFLPEYDYYFWVDSTHELIIEPHVVINDIMKYADIGLFKHTQRDCVYEESEILLQLGYDHPNLIKEQMEYYKREEYPQNVGLYELPCFVRKNTEKINTMNLMWWELISKYSSRDQISLPFVLNKLKITPFIFNGCANCGFNGNNIMPQVRNKFY